MSLHRTLQITVLQDCKSGSSGCLVQVFDPGPKRLACGSAAHGGVTQRMDFNGGGGCKVRYRVTAAQWAGAGEAQDCTLFGFLPATAATSSSVCGGTHTARAFSQTQPKPRGQQPPGCPWLSPAVPGHPGPPSCQRPPRAEPPPQARRAGGWGPPRAVQSESGNGRG